MYSILLISLTKFYVNLDCYCVGVISRLCILLPPCVPPPATRQEDSLNNEFYEHIYDVFRQTTTHSHSKLSVSIFATSLAFLGHIYNQITITIVKVLTLAFFLTFYSILNIAIFVTKFRNSIVFLYFELFSLIRIASRF